MIRRALLGLALVLIPATALGAPRYEVVLRGDDVALSATIRDGKTCVTLNNVPFCRGYTPYDAALIEDWAGDRLVAGAVGPEVATVELVGKASRRAVSTVAADGFTDRFFIAQKLPRLQLIRFLGADGRLLAAQEPDLALRVLPTVTPVLRSGPVRVTVEDDVELRALPGELDRLAPDRCVTGHSRDDTVRVCVDEIPVGDGMRIAGLASCRPGAGVIAGLVRSDVQSVRLTFGTGERRTYRTRPLPPGSDADRFRSIAVRVPRATAVRAATALDADEAVRATDRFAMPPSGTCDGSFGRGERLFESLFDPPAFPLAGPPQDTTTAAGYRLVVADGAEDTLCAGIGEVTPDDCAPPPATAAFDTPLTRAGRLLSGVTPADVATIDVRFRGGGWARGIRVDPGAGYTGRWAGKVGFVLARLPTGRLPVRIVARDAQGRNVGRLITRSAPEAARSHTAIRGRGFDLVVQRLRGGPDFPDVRLSAFTCPRLRVEGRLVGPGACADEVLYEYPLAYVACRPRATILFGFSQSGRPRYIQDVPGRELVPRTARVPKRFGGGVAYALRLPRDTRLDSPIRLRPTPGQCGFIRRSG